MIKKLKDVNGKDTDIDLITFPDNGQMIIRLHMYNMHEVELPISEINDSIDVYDYEHLIPKGELMSENYDWVEEIYKHTWKCICGNTAYNYNVRTAGAGEERYCPYCEHKVHTYDNRNWG